MTPNCYSSVHLALFLFSLAVIASGGCTFDDQFNDPAWKGKTWIDPEPGEKMRPDKVYGGII